MYKQLLRLWWTQKRRNFTWKDVMVYFYGYFLLGCMVVSFYFGSDGTNPLEGLNLTGLALVAITSTLVCDLAGKLFMKKEVTVMDDYLRVRPIRQRTWDAFLLTINLLDFWTWAYPIGVAFFSFLLLPPATALLAVLTSLSASMVNAMALTCCRRANRWWQRWPVILTIVFFLGGSLLYGIFTAFFPLPALQMWTYIVLNVLAVGALYLYLTHLPTYDEHTVKTQRVRTINAASRLALDWAGLWRTKRIRQSIIIIMVVMLADTYLMLGMPAEDQQVMANDFILLFVICGPSLVLSQWTFGIEANFFHGLWTKPVSVLRLLTNKFIFFALLNAAATVLLIPAVCLGWLSAWKLLAALVFTIGCANLVGLPTCLFSQRLDLFSSAFFNYQGASMKLNFYSIVCLLPFGLFVLLYDLLPELTANIILLAIGLLGLAIHRPLLERLARAYTQRRHERFEAYMQ